MNRNDLEVTQNRGRKMTFYKVAIVLYATSTVFGIWCDTEYQGTKTSVIQSILLVTLFIWKTTEFA